MTKPKLLPLQVPWQVSANPTFLDVSFSESGLNEALTAEFGAILLYMGEFHATSVKIIFQLPIALRILPAIGDQSSIEPSQYDWSAFENSFKPHEAVSNVATFKRQYEDMQNQWKSTGICPSPKAYEVIGDDWLASLPINHKNKFTHYLLEAHDCYLEAVASGFKWTSSLSDRNNL